MKRNSAILSIIFAFMFSSIMLSQTEPADRVGIGVSIDPSRIGHQDYIYYSQSGSTSIQLQNTSPILFYVPVNLNEKFRLEPSVGLYTFNTETTTTPSPETSTVDVSAVTLGIRGFYLSPFTKELGLYFGPKLELNFLSSTNESSYMSGNTRYDNKTELTETDITLGLVFGAEYFPVSHFSVGAEAGFNYTSFGNPQTTVTNVPPAPPTNFNSSRSQHSFHTDALIFIRWYFI